MGLFDILFGRSRPARSRREAVFAMATAAVGLRARLGLEPTGRAGVCLKPVASAAFEELERELAGLLDVSARETGARIHTATDRYGYRWVVVEDAEVEGQVALVHQVGLTAAEHGFGDQLLAAVFGFQGQGRRVYWVYHYKRGRFYPFVPLEGQRRDNALEFRLGAAVGRDLPVEPDHGLWYALWELPV